MDKLELRLKVEKNQFTINDDIVINATLTNRSAEKLLVNNRFLIGYEEQDDREIYFRIFSSNGKRDDLPKDHQSDILPIPITKVNIQQLAPTMSIKKNIRLTPIYKFREPGKCKVIAVYESKALRI